MTPHPYADILRAIADGEQIERRHTDGVWRVVMLNPLLDVAAMDRAAPEDYRRKPRVININGHEVPEPLRSAPEQGATVYCVQLMMANRVSSVVWGDDSRENSFLRRGLVHLSRESAERHADALLSFTAGAPR